MKTTIKVLFEGNSVHEINEQIFAYLSTQKGFMETVETIDTAAASEEKNDEPRLAEEITE